MRAWLVFAITLIMAGRGRGEVMKVPEPDVPHAIVVTSPTFADGELIPRRYTCHGTGEPPELRWQGVPAGTTSLALVVSDPDAPAGTFIHWLLYDLAPGYDRLAGGRPPAGAREADNSAGRMGWYPPCPPSGTHRYRFTVYALSGEVQRRSTQKILADIGRRAVALGTLTGLVTAE